MTVARVLIIDDDPALVRALRVALKRSDYEVLAATSGEQGISAAAVDSPDVVVLDLVLPDIDGLTVCRRIREWSDVPIIVLSATVAELRKVAALDEGANDYVTKPFGMAELEARIRAVLRDRRPSTSEQPSEITVGQLEIDLAHSQARLNGHLIKLTAREFGILSYLARNAGKVCTHQMILEAVWGSSFAKERQYLHAYIYRLRQKLNDSSGSLITTVPGIGYVLTIGDSDA